MPVLTPPFVSSQSFLRVILIWEATLVATGVTAIAAVATAGERVRYLNALSERVPLQVRVRFMH